MTKPRLDAKPILVRITKKERELIVHKATEDNRSLSEFMRLLFLRSLPEAVYQEIVGSYSSAVNE